MDKRGRIRILALGAILACGLAGARPAVAQQEEADRMQKSIDVVTALVKAPDDAIPQHILDRAEAIVVIPSLVKGGFVIGAEHGKGVMSVRNRAAKSWSAPAFVSMTGGSVGWQIGAQAVDLVLLVMNAEGIHKLVSTEIKLGANASVAAGPVGRTAQAATDGKLTAEILAYSRAKGLFAGATIEGGSLRDDGDANRRMYGASITPRAILNDAITKNRADAVAAWRAQLAQVIGTR